MAIQQMLLGAGLAPKTATLAYPSAHGQFYNTTAIDLSESDLTTGIELDPNDSSASTTAYPGAYKLILGATMTLEFHLWGGGSTSHQTNSVGSSGGGYTKYVCTFAGGTEIGIYIAGYSFTLPPTTFADAIPGGWPDGGTACEVTPAWNHGTGGNGSTRVGPVYANLTAMNASTATYYAIAGGAGGLHMYAINSGAGGGSSGDSAPTGDYSATGGGGGTQSAGGAAGGGGSYSSYAGNAGAKYKGGDGNTHNNGGYGGGGGGGGGYYGGGSGSTIYSSGGGGSGYIDTSHSGYQSGSTTTGTSGTSSVTGDSPAGSGVSKPSNGPGDANKNGGVIFKLN